MNVSRTGTRRPRTRAALAVIATLIGLVIVVMPSTGANAAPPPNPTDGQLDAARSQKDALASQVGQLSAQVATLQNQLSVLRGKQEMAEQRLAFALSKLEQAKTAAVTAKAAVGAAQVDVDAAHKAFVGYAQSIYMTGDIGGTTGSLLTATDPNALLEQSALQQYQSSHQISALGALQRATVDKSNADAAARTAVQLRTEATAAAATATQQADAAVIAGRAQEQQVEAALTASQTRLTTARGDLATKLGQRAAYDAYQAAEKARIAREAAARAAAAEAARVAAAKRIALAAEQAAANQNNGGSGGSGAPSGGGAPVTTPVTTPVGGSWTPARGQQAADRAMQWIGTMYAWAGGNANGPTRGVCAGDGAYNDCNVIGFDCSGLVLYAWGPYRGMDHYAATQYSQAGSYHPSFNALAPGDLVFWSYSGSQWDIHHVAVYIGGGQIVEAPQSGVRVRIASLYEYGTPYGATRPLT